MKLPPIASDVFEYCRLSDALVKEGMTRDEADDEIRRTNELVWIKFRSMLLRQAEARANGL